MSSPATDPVLAELRRALLAAHRCPGWAATLASLALDSSLPGAELAAVVFDSLVSRDPPPDFGDPPETRVVAFRCPHLGVVCRTLRREPGVLVTCVVSWPAGPGHRPGGEEAALRFPRRPPMSARWTSPTEFVVEGAPAGPAQVVVRAGDESGSDVVTDWFVL